MTEPQPETEVVRPRRRGRPRIHPVDYWLDGEDKLLLPGAHWLATSNRESVRSTLLREARKRGILVKTANFLDGLEVRFLGTRDGAGAAVGPGGDTSDLDAIDWDTILRPMDVDAGGVRLMVQDHDFVSSFAQLAARAYREADARGVVVRVKAAKGTEGRKVAIAAMVSEEAWAARDAHLQTLRAERAKL